MTEDGLLFSLYRGSTAAFSPLSGLLLKRRLRQGKEDPSRLRERMGFAGRERPGGFLVWMHGASVGEGLALLPLVERFMDRGVAVLITTGTVSSARVLEGRLPPAAIHQFIPIDVPAFMTRFLAHWRPDLVLLAESELWPNLTLAVAQRGTPLALVNARMSERSFRRWRRAPRFIGAMLHRTTLCMAQTPEDAARLAALGARTISVTGNLKYDVPAPPADPQAVAGMAEAIGSRPVWVAASIHQEEEDMVLAAHRRCKRRFAGLLTIVAPRRVERGPALAEAAAALGFQARLRSRSDTLDANTDIYIADTMGELGLVYSLSQIVFVGKSLGGGGGQNPIEPAKMGGAILHGTQVDNFKDVYRTLDEAGGALALPDGDALAERLGELLADRAKLRRMAHLAAETVDHLRGATDRILRGLAPYLPATMDEID